MRSMPQKLRERGPGPCKSSVIHSTNESDCEKQASRSAHGYLPPTQWRFRSIGQGEGLFRDLRIRGRGIHPFRWTNIDTRYPRPYTPLAAIVAVDSVRIAAGVVTAGEGGRTTGERDAERCKNRAQKNPTANHGCLSFPSCPPRAEPNGNVPAIASKAACEIAIRITTQSPIARPCSAAPLR